MGETAPAGRFLRVATRDEKQKRAGVKTGPDA